MSSQNDLNIVRCALGASFNANIDRRILWAMILFVCGLKPILP